MGFIKNKIYSCLRNLKSKRILCRTGRKDAVGVVFGKNTTLDNPRCIFFGDNVRIGHNSEFFPLVYFHGQSFSPKIVIGNNTIIGDYNRFACQDEITIEENVLFAAYVHITDHSHDYRDCSMPIMEQGTIEKGPVRIGKNSWIGIRCSILSGVTIGEHSVIAAGSIVTHDIPPFSIAAGVPARVIKKYDFNKNEWVAIEKSN